MSDETTSTQTHLTWREMERPPPPAPRASACRKVPAGLCGILLGAIGLHKFVLGYPKQGTIMLLVTVLTLGFGGFLTGLVGVIEGIIYLTKSDEDFVRTYVTGRRGWF